MAETQPLDATFYAFRGRKPKGVLLTASVAFVVAATVLFVLFGLAMTMLAGPSLADQARIIEAMARGDAATMQSLLSPQFMILTGVGNIVFWLFIFMVLLAAFEAACLRWMIHGRRDGLFGLDLGADTWRVYGAYWMWLIVWVIGVIAWMLLLGLFFGAVGALGHATGQGWLAGLLGVLGGVALILCLPVYLITRLSPAAATSIARQHFGFFHAWTTSRGRFWALFGAYLLLWLLNLVVSGAFMSAWFGLMMPPGAIDLNVVGKDSAQLAIEYEQFLEGYMTALLAPHNLAIFWALQAVAMAISLFFYVLYYGVNARAAAVALEEGKFGEAPAAPAG